MNLRLRARLKERKIKNKKNQTQNSPQENLNKVDKDINNSADKENNCMNKVSQENKSELKSSFEEVYEKEMQPKTKESDNALDLKHSDCDSYGEESREIDELKAFLKNCCKRKVLLKPNIPLKWISDIKAKLAKPQSN